MHPRRSVRSPAKPVWRPVARCGDRTKTATAAERRPSRRGYCGRARGKGPARRGAHHGRDGVLREAGEATTAMKSSAAAPGRRRRSRGRRRRFSASRVNSSGWEVEHSTAELVAGSARLGEARSGGDASATASSAPAAWGEERRGEGAGACADRGAVGLVVLLAGEGSEEGGQAMACSSTSWCGSAAQLGRYRGRG